MKGADTYLVPVRLDLVSSQKMLLGMLLFLSTSQLCRLSSLHSQAGCADEVAWRLPVGPGRPPNSASVIEEGVP